jgi:GNAT acetyltransferase-like protein
VSARDGVADGDWDSLLRGLGGHFLQSTAWQRVQLALGHEILWQRGEGWLWAGAVRSGRFPRYLYVPYGPTAAPGSTAAALVSARHAGIASNLDFIRVEPVGADAKAALTETGALSTNSIQPPTTWLLELVDEEQMRSGLSAGHRGSINAATRRGVSVRSSTDPADIDVYLAINEKARQRRGFRGQSERYHRIVATTLMPIGASRLYVAEAEGVPVAAATCFDFADTRYYASAVSDPFLGRRAGAAVPLVWRMILDARRGGLRYFDFWGIAPDDDPAHPWAGFTQFKKAFGGHPVQRAGTWDLPVRTLRYRAYRAARQMRR